MRPAGMSSDEDFDDEDDCYFTVGLSRKKRSNSGSLGDSAPVLDCDSEFGLDYINKVASFHKAAKESDFEAMRALIEKDVSVDDSEINDWTPLMKACARGRADVVKFLLENGANPNLHKNQFTPLMACCMSNYVPEEDRLACVRILIQSGASVNANDKHNSTPLILAVTNRLENIVDELLSVTDININHLDKEGWNALFYAVSKNYKSVVEKLINAGVDINMVSEVNQYTALQLAKSKGHTSLFKMLRPDGEIEAEEIFENTDPLEDFLNQLPDEQGQGGFSKEVRNIFLGLGLEKLYDKLNINISLQDFLCMTDDLERIGINLEPIRRKIIIEGIHRYHTFPWKEKSLDSTTNYMDFKIEDCVNSIANVTKHLTILYATLNYMKIRVPKRKSGKGHNLNKELMEVLVNCYDEIKQMEKLLKRSLELIKKIKSVGEVEADFVAGKTGDDTRKYHRYLWITAVAVSVGSAALYYKLQQTAIFRIFKNLI